MPGQALTTTAVMAMNPLLGEPRSHDCKYDSMGQAAGEALLLYTLRSRGNAVREALWCCLASAHAAGRETCKCQAVMSPGAVYAASLIYSHACCALAYGKATLHMPSCLHHA